MEQNSVHPANDRYTTDAFRYLSCKESEQLQDLIPQLKDAQAKFNILLQDAITQIKPFEIQYQEQSKTLAEISKVQQILTDHQIVYWNFLDSKFIRRILSSKNIDRYLAQIFNRKNSRELKNTISACSRFVNKTASRTLFHESIYAFYNNKYTLCIVGLVAIMDYLLSQSSGSTVTSIANRVKLIEQKIINNFELITSELSEILLCSTFSSVMISISENTNFNEPEPVKLNRHWIMHGRSHRKYTSFDCMKIIRIIYALLTITESITIPSN
ncbi:MAG: hypothetical protein GX417_12610 [Clostridiales bacterium]|nr:hypothetical protein [Clostridiales bacterium]